MSLTFCWAFSWAQQNISYLLFDESFSKQVILQEARKTIYEGEQQFSPNHLGSIVVVKPNFSEKAPWSTTLFIQHSNYETMQLSLLNHANIQVTSTWINDELLHIKVWWGRVVGSDLILDLSTARFMYKRMFVYDLYSDAQAEAPSEATLPDIVFKLEHTQGAPPQDFQSFELLALATEFDTVRQFTVTTLAPIISNCYLEASLGEIWSFEAFLQAFITEQLENAPPRPLETVCRNCTIYEMTWVYQGISGSFAFSEQRPFRYPSLDSLLPLIDPVLKRMTDEAECDA